MSLQSDRWIRKMAKEKKMIEPFSDGLVREVEGKKIVSYGLSSYGYDLRVSNEFKVFTNLNNSLVDPKAFVESAFVDVV
nr:Deoxycytidine triphosphate deaminase [Chlamydiota bacterium]